MGEADNKTQGPTFEELKPMLRPTGIVNGIMKADPEKCKHCGLCLKNCPFKCWEMDENEVPRMKKEYLCFSCYNCMIACPEDAVSIVRSYEAKGGFFDTDFPPAKMPLEPKDAEGNPAAWTEIERVMLERRSVRNFKKTPVPEPLIERILEAGRFAPSAGNHQPWKFTVVTDPEFLAQLEGACHAVWGGMYPAFADDQAVMNLVGAIPTGAFDPRVVAGIGCVARKELPVYLNAPVVIFAGGNDKMVNPEMHIGICGQNMNLAARALGLGFCWSGFGTGINFIPEIKAKLGFADPSWNIQMTFEIGYPAFKQQGMVPRHYRPVTWFRPGGGDPEIRR